MTSLASHQSSSITKLLLMGDSGLGKTGALASLVHSGYKLHIADFDNGLDILANILRDGTPDKLLPPRPDLLSSVQYETFTDKFRMAAVNLIPATAEAWPNGVKWIAERADKLGIMDILVLDSLTFAGKSALRFIQKLQARLAVPPQIQDFRDAQLLVENLCGTLYSSATRCNIIALSHIREIGKTHQELVDTGGKQRLVTIEDAESRKGYAETGTGRALSPQIGRYFNAILMADHQGSGQSTRKIIRTVPHENIGLKNSNPSVVKPVYPLTTGLADYFKAVRGTQVENSNGSELRTPTEKTSGLSEAPAT